MKRGRCVNHRNFIAEALRDTLKSGLLISINIEAPGRTIHAFGSDMTRRSFVVTRPFGLKKQVKTEIRHRTSRAMTPYSPPIVSIENCTYWGSPTDMLPESWILDQGGMIKAQMCFEHLPG